MFEAAEKPMRRLPVRLGEFKIAQASVNSDGLAAFPVPQEVYEKIERQNLVVRTLHYHPDEARRPPEEIKIVGLCIMRRS